MINLAKVNRKRYPKKQKKMGRPFGSGPWGERTKQMQIPVSLIPLVTDLMEDFIKSNGLGEKADAQLSVIKRRYGVRDAKIPSSKDRKKK